MTSMLSTLLQATATSWGPFAAPLGAGIAAIGAGIGIGKIGAGAMEAIGRQPEAASDIRMSMIIVAALLAIIVCLMAVNK